MTIQRIPLETLSDLVVVGERLPFRVLDAQARLLLNEGHLLASERQRESLIERGAWAESDKVEKERAARALIRTSDARVPSARIVTLFDAWERPIWALDALWRRIGKGVAAGDLAELGQLLVALADHDADVALYVAIHPGDRRFALYPLAHAIHACALAALVARTLDWPADRIRTTACAALTMNLAMIDLQAAMAELGEPPKPGQLTRIRAHTDAGVDLLRAAGVDDPLWLDAVRDHHEHADGTGYPRGATVVGEPARLVRAVDVYLAKLSARAQRPPLTPQLAARQLFQQQRGDPVAVALVKTVGVYPPGDVVRLKSGETAVVIRRTASAAAPRVALLADGKGRPVRGIVPCETSEAAHAIVEPVERSQLTRVIPERVYGLLMPPGSAAAAAPTAAPPGPA